MAKKKKVKAVAASSEPTQLSDLEKKLRDMSVENEQIKAVAADTIKQLELLKKARALRRLEVSEEPEIPETPEPELPANDSAMDLIERLPGMEGDAEEYEKNSAFERTLRTFNERNTGTIEIFRIRDNGTEAKIGNYSVGEWGSSLDKIAKSFGGGEFKAIIRDRDGHYKGATRVAYDEAAYPKPNSLAGQPTPINSAGEIAEVVKNFQTQLERQQDKMFQLILATMQKPAPSSPVSSLEDFIKLNKLMQPNPDNAPNPLKDVTTLLGLFQKGVEAGQSMSPQAEEKGDFDFMSMIKSFAPALAPAIVGAMAAKPKPSPLTAAIQDIRTAAARQNPGQIQNPPAVQQPPQPAPQPEQPAAATAAEQPSTAQPAAEAEVVPEPVKEENNMGVGANLFLMMYKGPVIDMAKTNHDPEKTAEMIVLRIPEQYYPVCLDFCVKPERLELTYGFIPELREYPQWVEQVLTNGAEILQEYFKQIDDDTAAEAQEAAAKNIQVKTAEKAEGVQPSIEEVEKEQKGNK